MKQIQAIALLPMLCFSLAASAADLTMNTYVQMGSGAATVSDLTNSGASVTYETKNDRNDIGIASSISSTTPASFTQVGDTLTYSFHLGGISATNNNATPLYRVGFDFGSTAALRYETSTGTQENLRFGSNNNGNPFAQGVTTDKELWSPFDLQNIRFNIGNEIDVVVSLQLVAITSATAYDYEMTVSYQSTLDANDRNTTSCTFMSVNGNQVVSLYHTTNNSGMVATDAYTISSAALEFTSTP
jgi:hypothetical protein